MQLSLLGGGVLIQGPAQDSSDPSAQHGFLQKLSIHVSSSVIAGNAAAEGGGLWSAWPVQMTNCTITGNLATHAVSFCLQSSSTRLPYQLQTVLLYQLLRSGVQDFLFAAALSQCAAKQTC
jgi:hypothetical protein